MIGSFITRGLVLIFGYVYPAYECYKTVEMNKPDIELLRFWCQYWILVALLTVCERIGDMFIGWVPMYGEAKLAFFIYLWFPKTRGTAYVYDSFFRPYVAKHETDIDRNLLELRTRSGDMALLYWQKAASYAQTRVFEILQYIASQSSPPRPVQSQQPSARVPEATTPKVRSAATTQPQDGLPSSPASSTSSSSEEDQEDESGGAGHLEGPKAAPAAFNEQKTISAQALLVRSISADSTEGKTMQIDAIPSTSGENALPASKDTVMEEAGRVLRPRSRKTRAASK